MFKFHAKKNLKYEQNLYDKICVFENIHTKMIIVKRNLELNDLEFLLFSKSMPWLVQAYIDSFFNLLYHTSLISPNPEIDETVNFRNFRKLFTNKFAALFVALWHPIFKREKRNEVTGHMKHAAMTVTCTLHGGSWCSY